MTTATSSRFLMNVLAEIRSQTLPKTICETKNQELDISTVETCKAAQDFFQKVREVRIYQEGNVNFSTHRVSKNGSTPLLNDETEDFCHFHHRVEHDAKHAPNTVYSNVNFWANNNSIQLDGDLFAKQLYILLTNQKKV